jgi:hypothetical protein
MAHGQLWAQRSCLKKITKGKKDWGHGSSGRGLSSNPSTKEKEKNKKKQKTKQNKKQE